MPMPMPMPVAMGGATGAPGLVQVFGDNTIREEQTLAAVDDSENIFVDLRDIGELAEFL